MSDARKAAAEERRRFYEAAGIKSGDKIIRTSKLAFERSASIRPEWAQYRDDSAAPLGVSRRVPAPAEMRSDTVTQNGEEKVHFNGIASVTDTPYRMYDWLGEYDEVITRSAFEQALATQPDVAYLINHAGISMARTTSGSLILGMTPTGLGMDAYCNPKRSDVHDLHLAVTDKDITEMSFAFMLDEAEWSEDFDTFTISRLSLDRGDVSAVTYGANPYTSINARQAEIFKAIDRMPLGAAREAARRIQVRADVERVERQVKAFELTSRSAQNDSCGPVDKGRSVDVIEALLYVEES